MINRNRSYVKKQKKCMISRNRSYVEQVSAEAVGQFVAAGAYDDAAVGVVGAEVEYVAVEPDGHECVDAEDDAVEDGWLANVNVDDENASQDES